MILVTGGTGLVGSHLLYRLVLENESVKAIHQKSSDLNAVKKVFSYYTDDFELLFKKILWVEAHLNDIPALELAFLDITHVYHCAAFVSFDPKDYKKMRKINIEGTTNIVNICISNSVKKLCYTSSISTLEKGVNQTFIDESENWTTTDNKSGYSITKYGAEKEVWRASQEGIDVVIVNPGVILGSGFWNRGTGAIFTKIYYGFKFYTEGITGFVDVRDVVDIMVKLMKSKIKNERYIFVANNLSFKDLFFKIAFAFKVSPPKINISKTQSEIFWRIDRFKSLLFNIKPLLTKFSARSSQEKRFYTSQKIESLFNYQFKKIDNSIKTICENFESDTSN